ncbi:MAG: DUF1638 domain-containing protein [Geminicoccaceae bacterium]|nr:DUF1638 domain-containing protein [Geminicoccaceae bacterium]
MRERVLIIACGALAPEIRSVLRADGLDHVDLTCLPADLHMRPQLIAEGVRLAIRRARGAYDRIYCAYAQCGADGLDAVLEAEGVERIDGPHCYAFYAGQSTFVALADAEPATFYLTDFLARQFDRIVLRSLGADRHPELMSLYFGNYRRLVYLAQTDDAELTDKARRVAAGLGLEFERRFAGLGELGDFVRRAAHGEEGGAKDRSLLARHSGPGDRQAGPGDGEEAAWRALRAGHRPGRDARRPHRQRRLSRTVAPERSLSGK